MILYLPPPKMMENDSKMKAPISASNPAFSKLPIILPSIRENSWETLRANRSLLVISDKTTMGLLVQWELISARQRRWKYKQNNINFGQQPHGRRDCRSCGCCWRSNEVRNLQKWALFRLKRRFFAFLDRWTCKNDFAGFGRLIKSANSLSFLHHWWEQMTKMIADW